MKLRKKCIATSRLFGLVLILVAAPAFAGVEIGIVTQLNGPLLLKRANGMLKALAVDSFVEQGDVLVTEKDTYAQLRFADESEMTLGPDTLIKIESYTFNVNHVDNQDSVFSLGRGSVQIKTGLGGDARPDRIKLMAPNLLAPTATLILSRAAGTQFVAHYFPAVTSGLALFDTLRNQAREPGIQLAWNDSDIRSDGPVFSFPQQQAESVLLATTFIVDTTPASPASSVSPPPGLYLSVIGGSVVSTNLGGTLTFGPGQFGYTVSISMSTAIVPQNPGLQFTPPPAFSMPTGYSPSSVTRKSNAVDCEVR